MKICNCNPKKIQRFAACCVPVCIAMFFLMQTVANATPANKEIILSFNLAGWPPYLIHEEKNGFSGGIMIDVLRTVASEYGYKVTIHPYPEKRGLFYLDEGKVDAFPKAKEWTKHPENHIWSDEISDSSDVFVFMREKPIDYRTPEDLFGKRVGTVQGYGYPLLDQYFEDKRIVRDDAKSEHQMLMMLSKQRYDVAIINKIVALWIIAEKPEFQGKFGFSEKHIGNAAYRFMFTAKHDWKPFVEKLNRELKKMRNDGRLENILMKYR